MYPEEMVKPMRQELVVLGCHELKSKEDVDTILKNEEPVLIVINSVCGCAASNARPGVKIALEHEKKPAHLATALAGNDVDAVNEIRARITDYPPSSPAIALFKSGKLVAMLQRGDIEGFTAEQVAEKLTKAFDEFC